MLRKAKERDEKISSSRLNGTTVKVARYFSIMFVLTFIDLMQMLSLYAANYYYSMAVPLFPLLTLIAVVFFGLIEVYSIYERADSKVKAREGEAAKIIAGLLSGKNINDIINILNTNITQQSQIKCRK